MISSKLKHAWRNGDLDPFLVQLYQSPCSSGIRSISTMLFGLGALPGINYIVPIFTCGVSILYCSEVCINSMLCKQVPNSNIISIFSAHFSMDRKLVGAVCKNQLPTISHVELEASSISFGERYPTPYEPFRGGRYVQGQLPHKETGILWTRPKSFVHPARFPEKPLPLYSWRPHLHKSYIECISSPRFKIQYICFTSIESISNWLGFHFWSETNNKACN